MGSFDSKYLSFACAGVLALFVGACGASTVGGKDAGAPPQALMLFPKQAELASIADKPMPKVDLPKTAPAMDEWGMAATPDASKSLDIWAPTSDWDKMFAKVVDASSAKPQLTTAMACVAQEVGQFYLEHKAPPDMSVERFMTAACGNVIPHVRIGYITLDVPANVPDDVLFKDGGPKFEPLLSKYLSTEMTHAGFWFGRRGNQVAALVVSAKEQATLKPGALAPNDRGDVIIEGRVQQSAQSFSGYINQGTGAAVRCAVDMSVPRPAFRIVCPMDPKDDVAWVQVSFLPPKRALGSIFLQTLVRRTPDVQPRYTTMKYGAPALVKTQEEFTTVVADSLNRARKSAGLAPVKVARAESVTAAKVAPHYFAAAFGAEEPRNADVIAMGLLAGWDVQGMIRDAHFVSVTATTLDANRWLAMALEMPIGRHTLFAREMDEVALGPAIMTDQGITGALAVGYRLHRGANHADDQTYLLARVKQARQSMGLSEPKRILNYAPIMNEELARLNAGTVTPHAAMENILQRSVASTNMSTRILMIQTSSLDELELPDEVLRQPSLRLDIGVTHFKAPGAAWAQYAIVVVFVAQDQSADSERVASVAP